MPYVFKYQPISGLPKLAWLASIEPKGQRIKVIHGPAVECRDKWLVEGVWDGEFEKGEFPQSEAFFGSGLAARGKRIYACASAASVDRLLHCRCQGRLLVSNSLILLLAYTGARLDGSHDYWRECLSILKGVDNFDDRFKVVHPEIEFFHQVFYGNLIIEDGKTSCEARSRQHGLNSYVDYLEKLIGFLTRIKHNYSSPQRHTPLTPFTTLSEGYDSTAVSCLAADLGVKAAFVGNSIDPPLIKYIDRLSGVSPVWQWQEDAQPLARALGLKALPMNGARSGISERELYFLAANYPKRHTSPWSELAFHGLAAYVENSCPAAVVFTGYHGDMVWGMQTPAKYISTVIRRKDMSGLNLGEIRLQAGFINLAVPFIMAGNIEKIISISHQPDMEPWRVFTDYDRPIPRRIAESAGVPRELFGREKKFVADRYMWPVNRSLRHDFFEELKRQTGISRALVYLEYATNLTPAQRILRRLGISKSRKDYFFMGRDIDLYYLMNHWAAGRLVRRTARILDGVV